MASSLDEKSRQDNPSLLCTTKPWYGPGTLRKERGNGTCRCGNNGMALEQQEKENE